MSEAMLFAISLAITVFGLVASYRSARRRGLASGMRGAAWSLVPLGATMTGVTKFATDLVFSPMKWAGVVLAGLAVVLYMVSGVMLRRGVNEGPQEQPAVGESGRKARKAGRKGADGSGARPAVGPSSPAARPADAGLDPDLADIEEILRRRGIQ